MATSTMDNFSPTETTESILREESPTKNKRFLIETIFILLVLLITLAVSFFIFYSIKIAPKGAEQSADQDNAYYDNLKKNDSAYYESLLQNNPGALQDSFAKDIVAGVNDMYTKSDAYFITHRFFDNNGNIYEIYDYIAEHPQLVFLNKEAESIYPDIFKEVKNRTLPATYSYSAYYVYLAYVEVLYKYGYADIAALATAANQYAGNAYFKTIQTKIMTEAGEAGNRLKNVPKDEEKSLYFLSIANIDVEKILKGSLSSNDMPAHDILVGLNQYAAALRYLQALGVNATSTRSSKEIFAFTMGYSSRVVLELHSFTSLLNASTLAILDASTSDEIRNALPPILNFDTKKQNVRKGGVIDKIINSRFEMEPKTAGSTRVDIYSKRNVVLLSSKVPEFKAWLVSNGWVEADFEGVL